MFFVVLTYQKPIAEVEKHLEEHIRFLDAQYEAKKFIFSGRRNPRVGGVILVNSTSREEVLNILQDDPFKKHEIAEYELIEFTPSKYDERFASFLE
ncbi:GTP cyclohydrolase [Brevibacillus fluminis]|uniref:GTP cyclohydrolase n=1 Tax=Brevibacillus fluminis TaxID=511487 RepID=A0A3M8DAL6_9BACL|nr:YciI family protein [Brevibacillus fluminis]RNB85086.1 GTP cyclohydrolase [Brevibacillus fluminis]